MPKRRITRILLARSLIFNVVGVVGGVKIFRPFFGEIFGYPFALSLSKGGSTEFVARKDCGTNMSQNQVLVVCSVLSRVPHGLPILPILQVEWVCHCTVAVSFCNTPSLIMRSKVSCNVAKSPLSISTWQAKELRVARKVNTSLAAALPRF
jgi:hypothetical protein